LDVSRGRGLVWFLAGVVTGVVMTIVVLALVASFLFRPIP
jgi:hypothetical protein